MSSVLVIGVGKPAVTSLQWELSPVRGLFTSASVRGRGLPLPFGPWSRLSLGKSTKASSATSRIQWYQFLTSGQWLSDLLTRLPIFNSPERYYPNIKNAALTEMRKIIYPKARSEPRPAPNQISAFDPDAPLDSPAKRPLMHCHAHRNWKLVRDLRKGALAMLLLLRMTLRHSAFTFLTWETSYGAYRIGETRQALDRYEMNDWRDLIIY